MSLGTNQDSMPLTLPQLGALAYAATRELTWGLRETSREVARWRALAAEIPDAPLRYDALSALALKRGYADGAALFSILPDQRHLDLLRLLVGYETILDFLDNASERHPTEENGRELHRALSDALDPNVSLADYYRHHPWQEDGGYLEEIVESCRSWATSLPSYHRVRDLAVQEAHHAQVLGLNHLPDPQDRNNALRRWATDHHGRATDLHWFELTGIASASVLVLALLTLASADEVSDQDITSVYGAYWPWIGIVGVMLDSYADEAEDALTGDHSYVAHYGCRQEMVAQVCHSISEAADGALTLRNGHRHAVILGCMIALYLSKDSARSPRARSTTRRFTCAGGTLTRLLLPILRAWRIAYSQRAS